MYIRTHPRLVCPPLALYALSRIQRRGVTSIEAEEAVGSSLFGLNKILTYITLE